MKHINKRTLSWDSSVNTHMLLTLGDEINWGEIVLTPNVAATLRDDFFAFVKGESWYRRNRISYKRGCLLCDPLGNGKTCVARAMARTPGFNAYSEGSSGSNSRPERRHWRLGWNDKD